MGVYTTIALLSGTVSHLGLLLAFFLVGVPEMALFNIFSVAWWLGALFWFRRSGRWFGPLLSMVPEILVHAAAATVYVGWDAGFWLYPVILIAGVSVIPRGPTFSVVIFVVTLALFGGAYLGLRSISPCTSSMQDIMLLGCLLPTHAFSGARRGGLRLSRRVRMNGINMFGSAHSLAV